MSGLLVLALIVTVLVLCSKLQDVKEQLVQTQHERDLYERIYNGCMDDLVRSTMPAHYQDFPTIPDWPES